MPLLSAPSPAAGDSRVSGRRYDPLEARAVMVTLYTAGFALASAICVLPSWAGCDRRTVAALTALTGLAALVVWRLPSLPMPLAVAFTALGNVLIATAQWGAGAGSNAVASLYALSLAVSFLFYRSAVLAVQVLLAAGAQAVVLDLQHQGPSWVVTVVVTVGAASASGMVVRKLADLRAHAEQELAWRAAHDGLTGLANRVALTRAWSALPTAAGATVSVLVLDLRGFKQVNDVLGHHYGDALLVQVAQRLRELAGAGLACRLGGDEFAVLLPGADAVAAAGAADAVCERLHQAYDVGGVEIPLGATIGVATHSWKAAGTPAGDAFGGPSGADGEETLRALSTVLAEADAAMYYAREVRCSVASAGEVRARLGEDARAARLRPVPRLPRASGQQLADLAAGRRPRG